jgi:tape measure domain-containing protein
MSSIDERVVKMKIDNSQFQSGVKSTSSLLEKLKQSLKLKGATDGIDKVSSAVSKFNMSGMQEAAISTGSKFSAMAAVAFSAIQKLTNAAIDCGQKIISSTTEGIREGFAEYEQYMGSIQTIMANTASKGTTLTQVNAALSELNTYADKTIYNFQEMTRNIGTFTAAGVDLKTSVSSIQGIANLAAVSGSTSQQASTAMYQLSQAIAAGTVKLMDWNSVVNAGMGGEVFQQALIRTSEHLKTGAKAAIEAKGSFRESLQTGWLTTQVLTDTLNQFALTVDTAEDYNNAIKDLVSQGYTQEEAKQIADMAKTAMDAATKVKTFSQLIDTLKEAVGSGWTTSWQLMIGDFEEAKDLWTGISDNLGKIINDSANARNALLGNLSTGYKQFVNEGIEDTAKFNESLTKVAKNHGVNIEKLINDTGSFEKACKQGWVTGDMLKESVNDMADSYNKMSDEERKNNDISASTVDKTNKLAQALNNGSISADEFAKKFNRKSGRENIIEGLSSAFSSLWKVIQSVKGAWTDIFPPMAGETLYQYTVQFRNLMESIKPSTEQLDLIKRSFKGLFAILDIGKQAIFAVIGAIGKLSGNGAMGGLVTSILKGTASLGDFLVKIDETIKSSGIFVKVANGIATGIQIIIKIVQSVINYFNDLGRSIKSSTDAFDVIGNKIESLKDKLKSVLSSSGDFKDKFSSIFDSVGDVITKVVTTITHGLGEAIKWITNNISLGDILAGLLGGGLFAMIQKISKAFDQVKDVFEKINGIFEKPKEAASDAVGLKDILNGVKDALSGFTQGLKVASIVAVAAAIGILAHSLKTMSEIDVLSLGTSITAMGAMMAMLNQSFKSLVKSANTIAKGKSIVKSAAALVIYAKAIQMLADAMVTLKDLDVEQIAKGLVSIGVMMFALNKSMKGLDKKVSLKTSVSLIAMAKAIQMLVQPIQQLSTLSWEQIAKGLTAVGGALGEMAGAMKLLSFSKVGLKNSVAMIAMAKAMQMMAQPLIQLSNLSWEEIGHGLAAMGGALVEMGIVLAALGKIGGFSSIFAAGSILMVVSGLGDIADALKKFGSMSWDEIGRGLAAMGGALVEMGIVLAALGKIGGFSSIFAAGAIRIVTNGLYDISTALLKMGGMSWSEIGRGLSAMGGALGEIGIVSGALGKLAGISGLIGAGSIRLVCDGLWDIATSLEKLGNMSWSEIGRGLTAMGGALGEIAIITGALGKFAGLSSLIGGGAILLAVQSLGDIADALKQMGSMSWDEVGRGLVAMGGALGEIAIVTGALGSLAGLPALLGGGAILLAVQSLGDIADALKKFGSMSWDEIGRGLAAMGGALGAAGLGSLMNSLSGFGAGAIATYAKPLGDLADSVDKWNGVSVPPNLESDLSALASGVGKFTFSGWGAENIPAVATGMSNLAPAISAWSGVSVPPNIESDLSGLASGVGKFTLSGWGAENLPKVATGMSQLAPAMSKWNGISIPPNISTDLQNLANGVKSFTLSGWGAENLPAVATGMGQLAPAINKWNGVSVPPNIKSDLQNLSDGIKSFTLAFAGGWSLGQVTGPLGDLAGSVKKWNGVSVPPNIGTDLATMAKGVKNFAGSTDAANEMNTVGKSLAVFANGVGALSGIDFATNASNIISFVNTLNTIPNVTTTIGEQLGTLAAQIQTACASINASLSTANIGGSFMQIATSVSASTGSINGSVNSLSSAFTTAANNVASSTSRINTSTQSNLNAACSTINGMVGSFKQAGSNLGNGLKNSFISKIRNLGSSSSNAISQAVSSLNSYYQSFYSTGTNLARGIANGLSDGSGIINRAAVSAAKQALDAANRTLGVHSPSREFFKTGRWSAIGLANGMKKYSDLVKIAGTDMAKNALDSANQAVMNTDFMSGYSPIITPKIDISNIGSSIDTISSNYRMSVSSKMARNIMDVKSDQNILRQYQSDMIASNQTVTDAINSLRDDVSNIDLTKQPPTELYIDGRKLASTIAKPMDQALGLRQRRGI